MKKVVYIRALAILAALAIIGSSVLPAFLG